MNRKSGAFSSIEVSDDLRCQVIPLVGKHISHFSSVEDRFFSEGDSLSDAAEGQDSLEDMTATRVPRRWLSRNRSLMAVAGAAVIASTVLLIRSGGHASDITDDTLGTTDRSATPELVVPPAALPAPLPQPSNPAVATHEPEAFPAPAPADEVLPPSPIHTPAGAAAGSDQEATALCKKAFDQRRNKDVLKSCADAFAATPSADAAVMLAKVEFDRGRVAQALDWAKKAIAIDADRADAYVFLGGAEQAAGRNSAAKAAYKRYLQLAPQGRYAADLRSVLKTCP